MVHKLTFFLLSSIKGDVYQNVHAALFLIMKTVATDCFAAKRNFICTSAYSNPISFGVIDIKLDAGGKMMQILT